MSRSSARGPSPWASYVVPIAHKIRMFKHLQVVPTFINDLGEKRNPLNPTDLYGVDAYP